MGNTGRLTGKPLTSILNIVSSRFPITSPRLTVSFSIGGVSRVLEIGCGDGTSSPLRLAGTTRDSLYIGLDSFRPGLKAARESGVYSDRVLGNAVSLPFKPHSFDAVIAIDVIEHLEKEQGWRLLSEAERVSEFKVVILTPNGYVRQSPYDDNPYQVHRSGWNPEDFLSRGYEVRGMNGLKDFVGERALPRVRPRPLGIALMYLTELVLWKHPENAFHLLALKTMRRP